MSSDEKALREKLLAEALKSKIPLAALDPTSSTSPTMDEAAKAFAKSLTASGKEQAGVIFQNSDGTYSYSIPTQQQHDGFSLRAPNSPDHKFSGIFHTHPGNDGFGQVFSPQDIETAKKLNQPSYVMFLKDGSIRKYIPGVTTTRDFQIPQQRQTVKVSDGDPLTELAKALTSNKLETSMQPPVSQPPLDIGEGK